MTLEEALREAAAKGLTHVTMWPVPSQDRKTLYWYARATPSTGHGFVQAQGLDIVDALTKVLSDLPKAPKRAKKRFDEVNPPISEMAQRDVMTNGSELERSFREPEFTATVSSGDALHQEHMQAIDKTIAEAAAAITPPPAPGTFSDWLPKGVKR